MFKKVLLLAVMTALVMSMGICYADNQYSSGSGDTSTGTGNPTPEVVKKLSLSYCSGDGGSGIGINYILSMKSDKALSYRSDIGLVSLSGIMLVPIMLQGVYDIPTSNANASVKPYVGAGIGYIYAQDGGDFGSSFGFQAIAGANLSNDWFGEAKYLFSSGGGKLLSLGVGKRF